MTVGKDHKTTTSTMATTHTYPALSYFPDAVGIGGQSFQDMACQCGMLTTIWVESNFSLGDDYGTIRQCPACHYKRTTASLGHRMVHMFFAGDNWPIHNMIRRSGYDRQRYLSHQYRDHGNDQHINGNNGEATNGDDFSYYSPPNQQPRDTRSTTLSYYSKSTHHAYGYDYTVVALGPPHSLVFQSFMDGDTNAQPIATETTKKLCVTKTDMMLKPKEVVTYAATPPMNNEVNTSTVRCKHCGNINTYLLSILFTLCMVMAQTSSATYLSDHAGEFAQCAFTTTTSAPLFTLPVGVCDFEISLSYSFTSGGGDCAASSCVLYADSTALMSLGLDVTPLNEISALPAIVSVPSLDTKYLHYRTVCSGEVLTVQTVAVTVFPEGSKTCCSLAWTVNTQQTVAINDTTPVKINVTTTSTIVDVNVTSILGQESNRVGICNITAHNGTVVGNYSCIVPKLLEVLPPDTATGPSYLGRPQYYTWTNFSGYKYPNFQPFNATNGAQFVPPDPIPVPSLPPSPPTAFAISEDANSFVTDINDALGSALVHLRRKLAPDNGYAAAKAKSHNKEKHCENGNTVQHMSDDDFRAYCLEAADKHGSLYHYVFNHLAYDEVIPERIVPVITTETFSVVREGKSVKNGSTANSAAPVAVQRSGERVERKTKNNTPRANNDEIPASKVQYDIILSRIAAKITSWELMLCYIIRNSGEDIIHLQRVYHRLKFIDDGSAAAGLACLYLSDSGFNDNIKMQILTQRADDVLRFSRFSCPLLDTIHAASGWDEVCALHLNKEMHTLIGNGVKVIHADKRTGTQVAPPHNTTYYVSPDLVDSENFIDWLAMMTAFDAYFTIGPKYAGDTVEVALLLADITQTTRIEAHFRLRGGVGDEDQAMAYIPSSAPLTPAPDDTGKRNTSATLPKDGLKSDDEKSGEGLPSAEILTASLANTFTATTKWSDSLFYTTVNSLTGLLERYAQSIKLTSSQFNNVGFKSCMNNYGMYFAHYLIRTGEGGTAHGDVYTSVDPSGPGNTTISYTKAGEDLVAAISTNNMLQVSQNLRIQTVPVNGTALYQAMTDSRNVVSCGLNGSFASVFYRIFANMYSSVPMVGTEHAPVVGNTNIVLPAVLTQAWEAVYWPLSLAHGNVLPIVNTMICTYSEFTGGRFGNLLFSQPQFGPNGYAWGNTTAVVPITLDMLNSQRGSIVAAWILAHMEYPYRRTQYTTTLVQDDNTNIAQWDGLGVPAISNSRCRGPIQNVLLVVSGINTVSNALDDFTVTVGTGGGAVLVTYNNNFAVGLGGVQVDIAAGLDSIYQAGVPFQQLWLEALNTAYTCYGNESDVKTAMLMVADSGTRIAPPALTAANLNLYGYVWGTPAGWNSTGLTDISAGNLAHLDGITCPLNMGTTVTIADVRGLSNAVCRIGQFNPLIAVDMVNGMYRPSVPPSQLFPQSTAAIVSCISRLSRMLTVSGDAALRATGLPMNYLFNPAASQALTAGNVNVLAAWRSIYDGINRVLEDQGVSATYLGSWFADRNSQYWQFFNAAHAALCAIARVPNFYMKYADIPWDAYCPELARTQLFGEYDAANFGFPNVGNPYERIISQAPEQSKSLTPYDILARLSPMFPAAINREPLEFVLMTKGGGSVVPVAFPNMYPSVGRSPALTLQNYGIITYQVVDLVDPPMDGTIPVFNPNVNNEVFPGFYGNSYGYYTRVPQVKYNKHEIANGDLFNYTILQNASGAPSLQNRLTKLSGKRGN